jgi:hypothetical protein
MILVKRSIWASATAIDSTAYMEEALRWLPGPDGTGRIGPPRVRAHQRSQNSFRERVREHLSGGVGYGRGPSGRGKTFISQPD